MRRFALTAACTLLAASLFSTPALAQSRDFVLINGTGKQIREVYVSASATDDWEEDVLGEDVLENGQRATITFPKSTSQCLHDIRIVHSNGNTADWSAIDLCKVSVVAVRYDADGDPVADTE